MLLNQENLSASLKANVFNEILTTLDFNACNDGSTAATVQPTAEGFFLWVSHTPTMFRFLTEVKFL